jgi:hypothetical protein
MIKRFIIVFYLIVSYLLVGYYIYESVSSYIDNDSFLFNNITMTFVCLGLSVLFLSFHVNNKIKEITSYEPNSDRLLKYYSISIFWVILICLINYFLVLWNSGFLSGKYLFWQLASLLLGVTLIILFIYLFNNKKRYYL